MADLGFTYTDLKGSESESFFVDLTIVARGPIDLGNGWIGDRVNFDKKKDCYIEFRTEKAAISGTEDDYACEVTKQYVIENYASFKEIN